MEVTSSADILFVLARGQQVGQIRRSLWTTAIQLIDNITEAVENPVNIAERDGVETSVAKRRAAWDGVLNATSKIAAGCEMLAQLESSGVHAKTLRGEVAAAAKQLTDLAGANVPDALLPDVLRDQLQAILGGDSNPNRFARNLLGLTRPENGEEIGQSLNWFNQLRLHALNAQLLSEISGASLAIVALPEAELEPRCAEMASRARLLRDAALDGARAIRNDGPTATAALTLWGAIYDYESWLIDTGMAQMAQIAAAATARVSADDADALRWAREAGQAYDALREGLAYDAGLRALLLSYALLDGRQLERFAAASRLPLGSATLDLPRSSPAEAAAAAEGTLVEVDGLVESFESRVGGPSNRSVLTIGGGALTILIPHVAADSFGITKGVWLQVRGKAFPNGKDGITGPVVMAGRIAGADTARASFTDALIHAGSAYFQRRPSDLDLVAGRVAGAQATLNEIGMRE